MKQDIKNLLTIPVEIWENVGFAKDLLFYCSFDFVCAKINTGLIFTILVVVLYTPWLKRLV